MQLVGANPEPQVAGLEELPGKTNYFIGNDPAKWRTNIPTYAKVKYEGVYPGVDLIYYGNQRQLEYDFVVAPGTNPKTITLGFEGADKLEVDAQGDLVLHTAGGQVLLHKPLVYQEVDGVRQEISGGYVLLGPETPDLKSLTPDPRPLTPKVGFQMAAYDTSRPLLIDPVLSYSTYIGPSDSGGFSIAVDSSGNAYVTGATTSTNFPTVNPFQATCKSCNLSCPGGGPFVDAFVSKLNSTGSALVYSTYLGGCQNDVGSGIAVDSSGNAYVTGRTQASDFPTTANAFQPASAGSGAGSGFAFSNAFVTKLDPAGSALVYSTYLGGTMRMRALASRWTPVAMHM